MIYKLVLPSDMKETKSIEILYDFRLEFDFELCEVSAGEHSECGNFSIIYAKLNEIQALFLYNSIKSRGYDCICEEYTNQFLNMLLESKEKLEEYKEVFGNLISYYENNISKDMVLDKANKLGFDSLNEYDYNILKA
jgi:hypothetical protein